MSRAERSGTGISLAPCPITAVCLIWTQLKLKSKLTLHSNRDIKSQLLDGRLYTTKSGEYLLLGTSHSTAALIKPEGGEGRVRWSEAGVLLSDCVNKRIFVPCCNTRVMFGGFCWGQTITGKKLQDQEPRSNNAKSFAFKCLLSVQTKGQETQTWSLHTRGIQTDWLYKGWTQTRADFFF